MDAAEAPRSAGRPPRSRNKSKILHESQLRFSETAKNAKSALKRIFVEKYMGVAARTSGALTPSSVISFEEFSPPDRQSYVLTQEINDMAI